MPEIMTADEVAKYLKLNKQTVYRKARKGEIPCARMGRALRFDKLMVDAWLLSLTWTQEDRERMWEDNRRFAEERGLTEEDILRACDEVRHGPQSGH